MTEKDIATLARLLRYVTSGSKGKDDYRGMHNGTVRGKGFEESRRSRKSHAERRAQIIQRSIALK